MQLSKLLQALSKNSFQSWNEVISYQLGGSERYHFRHGKKLILKA
jgi:hypothetical protein